MWSHTAPWDTDWWIPSMKNCLCCYQNHCTTAFLTYVSNWNKQQFSTERPRHHHQCMMLFGKPQWPSHYHKEKAYQHAHERLSSRCAMPAVRWPMLSRIRCALHGTRCYTINHTVCTFFCVMSMCSASSKQCWTARDLGLVKTKPWDCNNSGNSSWNSLWRELIGWYRVHCLLLNCSLFSRWHHHSVTTDDVTYTAKFRLAKRRHSLYFYIMPASLPLGTIFNRLCASTQNNPQKGFTWTHLIIRIKHEKFVKWFFCAV